MKDIQSSHASCDSEERLGSYSALARFVGEVQLTLQVACATTLPSV